MNESKLVFMPNQHELKALTWKQPFAELMLHGKIETRTWRTHYRGWVLICAGATPYSPLKAGEIAGIIQSQRITDLFNSDAIGEWFNGKAIAIGRLVDCRKMRPFDEDQCFVKFNPDLWCHVYEDVQAIEPIPWKGAQGWKNVPDDVKREIKILK